MQFQARPVFYSFTFQKPKKASEVFGHASGGADMALYPRLPRTLRMLLTQYFVRLMVILN